MNRVLKIYTPPAEEPISLDEAKEWLRVSHSDEDALILSLIKNAREVAELHQRREVAQKTYELYLDAWPAETSIQLLAPLISVSALAYRDSANVEHTLVSGTDYLVDTISEPGKIVLPTGGSWPSAVLYPVMPIRIRFIAGWATADVPETVRGGMLVLLSMWFDQRSGITIGSENHEIPFAAQALLDMGRLPAP